MNQIEPSQTSSDSLYQQFITIQTRIQKLVPDLTVNTAEFLISDLQKVYGACTKGEGCKARVTQYWTIPNFFTHQFDSGKPTNLVSITTEHIQNFLDRDREVAEKPCKTWNQDRTQLNYFFERALANNKVSTNPVVPLYQRARKLEPDWNEENSKVFKEFREYLDSARVGKLCESRKKWLMRELRTLLHDAEMYHALDPAWPTDLAGLFSDPHWHHYWLCHAKNRSSAVKSDELTVATVKLKLGFVRTLFYFSRDYNKNWTNDHFIQNLEQKFTNAKGKRVYSGRSSQIMGGLTELEQEQVYAYIEQAKTEVERLRNRAIFVTAISTTMRSQSLQSMQLDRFYQFDRDTWNCAVKVKQRRGDNKPRVGWLESDDFVWNYWYISPDAYEAIQKYLEATGRDWNSTGPVWLHRDGKQELSYEQIRGIIRKTLKKAGCKRYTNVHCLRHTGIRYLLNKARIPATLVQLISQHEDIATLIKVYGRGDETEAYGAVNQVSFSRFLKAMPNPQAILDIGIEMAELGFEIFRLTNGGQDCRLKAQTTLEKLNTWTERIEQFLDVTSAHQKNVIAN